MRRALELALSIADGLAFAHEHGLVHRDVKPQNILLSSEGEVKVTDFGIARSLHVEHGVTQTGTVLGTGEYLAPEQASGKPVSPATDVYSLGVVLWELLAGDVPFTGDNFVAVALRHVNEPPPHLRERRPDVSPRLDAAVQRALAKDPARRFPSMARVCRGAAACLAEAEGEIRRGGSRADAHHASSGGSSSRAGTAAARPRRPARTRRRPLLWAVLALLVAGVAFAAVLLLGGGGLDTARAEAAAGRRASRGAPAAASASYDPQGDRQRAHASTAPSATDGNTSTVWYDARPTTARTSAGSRTASGSSSTPAAP